MKFLFLPLESLEAAQGINVLFFLINTETTLRAIRMNRQTCEAGQEQLVGTLASTLVIVGNHGQGKLLFVERMAADDAEVIQANPGHCVQGNQHVSAHFFNRLQKEQHNSRSLKTQSPD